MITLLIKGSLVLIVLLAFYKLLLEKERFFAANRFYLLGCLLCTAILPFIGLPELVKHQGFVSTLFESAERPALEDAEQQALEPGNAQLAKDYSIMESAPEKAFSLAEQASPVGPVDVTEAADTPIDKIPSEDQSATRGATFYLLLLYGFGVMLLSLKLLIQIVQILWKIHRHGDKIAYEGGVLVNMSGEIDPCSFFRYIFINPAGYDHEAYEQIIAHELVHVRQWHTIDLLLAEMAVAVLWFNPFVWLLRKEVERNIEYQTDDLLLRGNAVSRESYQLNLVKIATQSEPLPITTNYNRSMIKKRILKMNAKRSNPYRYVKYAFALPLLFGLSLILNEPTQANDQADTAAKVETEVPKAMQFHSIQDTLILQTEKHPGYGLFKGGFGPIQLEALAEDDARRKLIPPGITDPEFGQEYIDFKLFHYEELKKSNSAYLDDFLEKWYPAITDTAHLPTVAENTVKVIVGKKDGAQVFILDQNNNLDFRDDTVRLLKSPNSKAKEPLRCRYRIYNGKEIIADSSWVYIGGGRDDRVWVSAAQHLRSNFSLGDQTFTVSVFNDIPSARWCFEDPLISITARYGIKKDTLTFRDKFELGEFLPFGQYHYQFAEITNDGSSVTLVRDQDLSDNVGVQPGLIAPEFSTLTLDRDSIALSDYRGQYLLLANLSAMCLPPERTYGHYKTLWDQYRDKIATVGIDHTAGDIQRNIDRLQLKGKFISSKNNPAIEKYRDFHCSEVCFLIGPDGRVVDRFEIENWQASLARHFKK